MIPGAVALLAPVAVVGGTSIAVLSLATPPAVAFYAEVALLAVVTESAGDLYDAVALLRLPRSAEFVNEEREDGIAALYRTPDR